MHMGTITTDIQTNVIQAIAEMNESHKERHTVVRSLWVGMISRLHVLLIGPGGTGKSFICRDLVDRILDAVYFEVALDETTDPSQVFGPPDIKAMVEDGKTRRVTTGMLPEADVAYFDEYFNANTPMLHSLRPSLNERLFHNNGKPIKTPLKMAVMGTNKITADTDHAPDWDRVHIREEVKYVADRQHKSELVLDSIIRRTLGYTQPERTQLSLSDIDIAYSEAMSLVVPEHVQDVMFDIQDELEGEHGIVISTRRVVEGMAAVLGNAWLNGHEEVTVGDLDILASMWWLQLDQRSDARQVILQATNPGEKEALEKLGDLEALRQELKNLSDLDAVKANAGGLHIYKNVKRLKAETEPLLEQATLAGTSTTRIKEVIGGCDKLMHTITKDIFGIEENDLTS
jgi:MoxR-like ATPase